ncbi:ABC transporter ATP-binding protein [Kribbella italica]|uniref:Putative ABC transport system ATP-binding protein n=1 Tax=Kribbella italica TaxID=1540520 RepID=A0A7W9MTJ5_9ACTN|nr:ABC transporter ATP-binding protein [Kribbella italica]MBB5834978.1 putative ABC transport system ATP-binding protein [Kribbella italica]
MTAEPVQPAVAIATFGLGRSYGAGETRIDALADVSVQFGQGRFTAIMGPSGSGKSTLLHCLAGLDRPTSGQVFLGDVDLTRLTEKALTHLRRDRVGFVFQAFNLVPTLTALENITLPLTLANRKPDQAWLDLIVETVGLKDRLHHKPSELSGGQQQRVACARALASRPHVVFADEPTGNLDSRASADVLAFLHRSVREFGQTVVMVTHDPTAAAYADRVLFLADGRLREELVDPTAESVLDTMKRLETPGTAQATASAGRPSQASDGTTPDPQAQAG